MQVVAVDKIKEAQVRYPSANTHLMGWLQILTHAEFKSESDLRVTFGDIRGFNFEFKFPIPETTISVHTLINFESQVVYIVDIKPGNQ